MLILTTLQSRQLVVSAYCPKIYTVQQPPKSLAIFHLAWKLFISYTQEAETVVGLGRESFSSSRSQVLLMQHSVTLSSNHVSLQANYFRNKCFLTVDFLIRAQDSTDATGAWHPWNFEIIGSGTYKWTKNEQITMNWHPWIGISNSGPSLGL